MLYVQRLKLLAMHVYKILNSSGPKYLHDMYTVNKSGYNTRAVLPLIPPKFETIKYGKNGIRYDGTSLWNALPGEYKTSTSFNHFKNSLSKWNGPKCSCTCCSLCSLTQM